MSSAAVVIGALKVKFCYVINERVVLLHYIIKKSRLVKLRTLGEVGVIQRRRAAVSVSTLRNDVKRSV